MKRHHQKLSLVEQYQETQEIYENCLTVQLNVTQQDLFPETEPCLPKWLPGAGAMQHPPYDHLLLRLGRRELRCPTGTVELSQNSHFLYLFVNFFEWDSSVLAFGGDISKVYSRKISSLFFGFSDNEGYPKTSPNFWRGRMINHQIWRYHVFRPTYFSRNSRTNKDSPHIFGNSTPSKCPLTLN